jgi:hypothetical protein
MASRLGESDRDLQHFVSQSPWSADLLLKALAQATAAAPSDYSSHRRDELSQSRQPLGGCATAVLRGAGQKGQLPAGGQPAPRRQRGGRQQPAARLAALFARELGGRSHALPARGHPARDGSPEQTRLGPGTHRPGAGLEVTARRGAGRRGVRRQLPSGGRLCASAASFTACARPGRPPAGRSLHALERPRPCAGDTGRGSGPLLSPEPKDLRAIAQALPLLAWKRVTWRHGTKGPQHSRFASLPLWAAHGWKQKDRSQPGSRRPRSSNGRKMNPRPRVTGWHACLRSPRRSSSWWPLRKRAGASSRTTANSRTNSGLDHFEGRSWQGFHHHVALVTAAFVFLRQEQRRLHRRAQKKAAATDAAAGAPLPPSRAHPPERPMPLVSHPLPAA